MRRARLLLWLGAIVLGVAAEGVAFGWDDPLHWVPDLLVGWTFIGCGLVAAERRPGNPTALLMVATGFTWFLGNFAGVDNAFVAWVSANAIFVYRGPLVHLLLAYPTGRPRGRLQRAAIIGGYAAAFFTRVWRNEAATIALALLLFAVSARCYRRSVGPTRRARLLSLRAAAGFCLVLTGNAVAGLLAGVAIGRWALLAYEVVLIAIGAGLFSGLVFHSWERAEVADLVVELDEARSGMVRGELSRALGDPSLEVGYWIAEAGQFVDAEGRTLPLPQGDSERSVTIVRRGGEPVAAILHNPTVLDDAGLLEAVSSAARLGASNDRLQAELQHRLVELTESRRRLLVAGDEERRRLERRLQEGAARRLQRLAGGLRVGSLSASGEATKERIARARDQLDQTLEELHRLALGLHPRLLSERGLGDALADLTKGFPVPVTLEIPPDRMPDQVEEVAYFVCSEALANVAKYARASAVRISVARDCDRVTLMIEDDGVGGADPARGSGLRGLADRVETLGGTLRVGSAPGRGTRLAAEIPLGGEAV